MSTKTPAVLFVLGEYLERLESIERQRPEEKRRAVPTHAELAALAGIGPTPFSRIVRNRTASLRRDLLGMIIYELRGRGFDTSLNDLLIYVEI